MLELSFFHCFVLFWYFGGYQSVFTRLLLTVVTACMHAGVHACRGACTHAPAVDVGVEFFSLFCTFLVLWWIPKCFYTTFTDSRDCMHACRGACMQGRMHACTCSRCWS